LFLTYDLQWIEKQTGSLKIEHFKAMKECDLEDYKTMFHVAWYMYDRERYSYRPKQLEELYETITYDKIL
jgi:hypothetical protein